MISVIIPAYNAEKNIKKCLASIRSQTYKNFEVIIIDDGSKDKTFDICFNISKIDSRFKVINKKNEGPSKARKFGLDIAKGEYISFIDSDDYIDSTLFEEVINEFSNGDVDLVQFGWKEVDLSGKIIFERKLEECIYYNEKALESYVKQVNNTNYLWNRIYKRSLFENVEFINLFAGEDSCVLSQIYLKATRVKNIEKAFYNYVLTNNSLCRSEFNLKKLDNIYAGKYMYNFHVNNKTGLEGYIIYHICSYCAQSYFDVSRSNIENKNEIKSEVLNIFNYYIGKLKNNKKKLSQISLNRYIFVRVFGISTNLGYILYWINKRGMI